MVGKRSILPRKCKKIKPKTIRFRLYLVRVFITDLQKGGRTYSFRAVLLENKVKTKFERKKDYEKSYK